MRKAAALVTLLALALTGCGARPDDAKAPVTAAGATAPAKVEFATYEGSPPDQMNLIMTALGGGVLGVRDGCLVLEHGEHAFTLVVFRRGTTISGDSVEVVDDEDGRRVTYRIGQQVSFGGGYLPVDRLPLPSACRGAAAQGEAFFAQSHATPD